MNQKVWGPHAWFLLHSVTFNYPFKPTNDDKKHVKKFFSIMADTLPCSICRKHYKQHLAKKPIQNQNRKELVYWLIDLHNIVNIQEQKPTLSYDTVIDMYSKKYGKELLLEDPNDNCESNIEFSKYTDRISNYNYILYFIIIILIGYLIYSNL